MEDLTLALLSQNNPAVISPLSVDSNTNTHVAVINPEKLQSNGKAVRRRCQKCTKLTAFVCSNTRCKCHKRNVNGNTFYGTFLCNVIRDGEKSCFHQHVEEQLF